MSAFAGEQGQERAVSSMVCVCVCILRVCVYVCVCVDVCVCVCVCLFLSLCVRVHVAVYGQTGAWKSILNSGVCVWVGVDM